MATISEYIPCPYQHLHLSIYGAPSFRTPGVPSPIHMHGQVFTQVFHDDRRAHFFPLSLPEIPDRREHRKELTGKPGKTAAPIWQRKNLKPLEAKGFEVVA